MPLWDEYFEQLKSDVADMMNSVRDRMNAQSSCAAQFVWSHLEGAERPWLHVDLAGPAFLDRRGTGYGVALLSHLARTVETADLS